MTRPRVQIHRLIPIILRPLILIQHHHRNRRAQRHPKLGARLDLHAVLLVAGRGEGGLPGAAARHLRLDVGFGEGKAGGAAVDDAAHGAAVGFAIAGGEGECPVRETGEERGNLRCHPEVCPEGRHGSLRFFFARLYATEEERLGDSR